MTFTFVIAAVFAATTRGAEPPVGGVLAKQILATWQCQDHLGVQRTKVVHSPWALGKHSRAFQARELNRWRLRYNQCRDQLLERKRQWNWQAWLPDKWRRIGVCETGLNWAHGNSKFVSAFGIWVGVYDSDAAYMGVRPWYVRGLGHPSPWEQYQAAVGHYKRFGGFSGWGCRGA